MSPTRHQRMTEGHTRAEIEAAIIGTVHKKIDRDMMTMLLLDGETYEGTAERLDRSPRWVYYRAKDDEEAMARMLN